jgi:hypothetical protein
VETLITIDELKEHEAYKNAEESKKREILGSILFRKIGNVFKNTGLIPRITGMLIDASVFDITDIEELIDVESILKERIDEAVELLKGNNEI